MRLRKTLPYIVGILISLSIATIIWAGIYVYKKGFTKKWREYVTKEFRKRGVEVEFSRMTLDPFKGLVARNVKVMDVKDRNVVLAKFDEIVLDLNYGNFLHGAPFLNAVDLRDASLSLPFDPVNPESKRLEINDLNARLLFPAHQAYLSQAKAKFYGISVSASGRLINIEAFKPVPQESAEETADRAKLIRNVISELRDLEYRGGPATLDIRFAGDLAKPDHVFAEATLRGQNIMRRGYVMRELAVSAMFRDGMLEIRGLELRDREGKLSATGGFDTKSKKAVLHLRSELNLPELLSAFDVKIPGADELLLHEAPLVEVNAEATINDPMKYLVVGRVEANNFEVSDIHFESLESDFSCAEDRWSARDFALNHKTGTVSGDLMQVPGLFRARLKSTIDPTAFQPFTTGKMAEFLSEWEFGRSPEITLSAAGPKPDLNALEIQGEITFGPSTFRGQPLKAGSTKFRVKDRAATYENIRLNREEGRGSGAIIYDFGRNEVRLKDLDLNVNPAEVIVWASQKLVKHIEPYRFLRPPRCKINGTVHYKRGNTTDLRIDVDAPSGMYYTFAHKELLFRGVSAKLQITPGWLQIHELKGTLFGGRVAGNADISIERSRPGYKAEIFADGVNFEEMTKLYFGYDDSKGLLSGNFAWRARSDDPRYDRWRRQARSEGRRRIRNSCVWTTLRHSQRNRAGYGLQHCTRGHRRLYHERRRDSHRRSCRARKRIRNARGRGLILP